MKVSNAFNISFYLAVLFTLISCASNQGLKEEDATKIQAEPKLLFLNYQINTNTNREKTIFLINQKVTDGKLKSNSQSDVNPKIGDLECSILDTRFIELEKILVKNPLVKIVEYINDLGNFEKRIVDLDSAQFSLRIQLSMKAKYIVIRELTESGHKKHITTEIK